MKAKTLVNLCLIAFVALLLYGVINYDLTEYLPLWYRAAAAALAFAAFLSVIFGDPSD